MADWTITTAVGTGEKGFAGDGGPASAALLNGPFDMAFDAAGNMYFSDTFNHRIRRVEAATGIITTIAGNGEEGYSGDGGPATAAALNEPYGVVVDRAGNVYTADRLNRRVRRIDAAFRHHHDARRHRRGGLFRRWRTGGAGGARRAERPRLRRGRAAPLHRRRRRSSGARRRSRERRHRRPSPAPASPSTAATAARRARRASSAPARSRSRPTARSISSSGRAAACARSIPRPASSARSPAPAGAATAATAARPLAAVFDAPKEMALDRDGSLLIVDTENHAIRRIDRASGIVTTIAGGRQGRDGDGGPPPRRARPAARRGGRSGRRDLYRRHQQPPHPQGRAPGLIVPYRIVRLPLAAVCAGIALALSPLALAEPLAAVTVTGKGVLTICRNWVVFRTCKPYDKIELPPRIAVGDRIDADLRQQSEGLCLPGRRDPAERRGLPAVEPMPARGTRTASGSKCRAASRSRSRPREPR